MLKLYLNTAQVSNFHHLSFVIIQSNDNNILRELLVLRVFQKVLIKKNVLIHLKFALIGQQSLNTEEITLTNDSTRDYHSFDYQFKGSYSNSEIGFLHNWANGMLLSYLT